MYVSIFEIVTVMHGWGHLFITDDVKQAIIYNLQISN